LSKEAHSIIKRRCGGTEVNKSVLKNVDDYFKWEKDNVIFKRSLIASYISISDPDQ